MHIKGRLLFLYKVGVLGAEPLGEGVAEDVKKAMVDRPSLFLWL